LKGRWKRRPSSLEERRSRETEKENDSKKSSFPMVSSQTSFFFFFLSVDFYIGEICYRNRDRYRKREMERKKLQEMWWVYFHGKHMKKCYKITSLDCFVGVFSIRYELIM
jgi:hypothetical protein